MTPFPPYMPPPARPGMGRPLTSGGVSRGPGGGTPCRASPPGSPDPRPQPPPCPFPPPGADGTADGAGAGRAGGKDDKTGQVETARLEELKACKKTIDFARKYGSEDALDILLLLREFCTSNSLADLIKAADTDNSGFVDFGEFKAMLEDEDDE